MYEERDRMIDSILEIQRVVEEKKRRLREMNLECVKHLISFYGVTLDDLGKDRELIVSRYDKLHTIEPYTQEDLLHWEEVMDLLEQMGH